MELQCSGQVLLALASVVAARRAALKAQSGRCTVATSEAQLLILDRRWPCGQGCQRTLGCMWAHHQVSRREPVKHSEKGCKLASTKIRRACGSHRGTLQRKAALVQLQTSWIAEREIYQGAFGCPGALLPDSSIDTNRASYSSNERDDQQLAAPHKHHTCNFRGRKLLETVV